MVPGRHLRQNDYVMCSGALPQRRYPQHAPVFGVGAFSAQLLSNILNVQSPSWRVQPVLRAQGGRVWLEVIRCASVTHPSLPLPSTPSLAYHPHQPEGPTVPRPSVADLLTVANGQFLSDVLPTP